MWEALITSIFSVLKSHFEEVIMRVTTWVLSFIVCWLFLPINLQIELMAKPLPALPDYVLVYLFCFVVATCLWQAFFMLLDIVALCIEKGFKRRNVDPQSERVEVNRE